MNSKGYILGFNIGNTNTKLGIYHSDEIAPQIIYTYKTDTGNTAENLVKIVGSFADTYTEHSGQGKLNIDGIIISSVVPETDEEYRIMARKYFSTDLIEISGRSKTGIIIKYDNPENLGADRIANLVAVFNEYKTDSIIIDLGTANTFSIINKKGNFEGGLIGPGIGISAEALFKLTSKLPRVDFEKPDKMIALNTVDAVKSGYFYSTMCMLNGIISEIEKLYNTEYSVVLTGGFSEIISNYLKRKHILDPILTMKGIKYIYNMNRIV